MRRLCESKESYTLSASEKENLAKHIDLDKVLSTLKEEKIVKGNATWNSIPFYRPKPTTECEDGYKGRMGIHEVLEVSSAIRDLVMAKGTADDIKEQAQKEGMLTMAEDGIFKAVLGQTTIEEVLRVVSE